MKMSATSYAALREFVKPVMTPETLAACPYSPMRYRWDCLWATVPSQWVCDQLYDKENLNDEHIDTALRKLMEELT